MGDFFDAKQQDLQTQFAKAALSAGANNNTAFDIQPRWIEIGSTIGLQDKTAKPNDLMKGLNLYPFIIASQTMHEFIAHTPQDFVLANVYDDNPAVMTMLNQKVGWNFFEPEADILKACKDTKIDTGQQKAQRKWLRATPDTLPHQARLILSVIDTGNGQGIENKKTGARVLLNTHDFSLAQEFRKTVEAIAYGSVSHILEQNSDMDMNSARSLVMDSLKVQSSAPDPAYFAP